jgi:hypothetical protein
MVFSSKADITGDNAVHAIGSATDQARVVILTATGGAGRFGDAANVGSSRGAALPQNVPVVIRASEADRTDYIQLSAIGAYVPSGTTLTIAFGL